MFNDHGVYNAIQEFEQNIPMVLSLSSVPSAIFFSVATVVWILNKIKEIDISDQLLTK